MKTYQFRVKVLGSYQLLNSDGNSSSEAHEALLLRLKQTHWPDFRKDAIELVGLGPKNNGNMVELMRL